MTMLPDTDNRKRNRQAGHVTFFGLIPIALVFCALMAVLSAAVKNVSYSSRDASLQLLDVSKQELAHTDQAAQCLLLYEDDVMGRKGLEEMSAVLSQMKVPFASLECGEISPGLLEDYRTLVLSVTHYRSLGGLLGELKPWVKAGGNLMILYPPEISGSFLSLSDLLGIRDCGSSYAQVDVLHFSDGFLLGGSLRDFPITDSFDSSLSVSLEPDCQVFARTTDQYPVPIIWRRSAGQGTVVVDNLGFLEKAYRGLHCAAYTLLDDSCIYPVINGAAFYIDDFPSPVPGGYARYIQRDYNLSVREFYTSRWWPDTYNLAKQYGIRYTGLVIEEYSDHVSAPFDRNRDTERYRYFGNMLLDMGGEIGLHGYNHMPLVLEDFDYEGQFDSYRQWRSREDMLQAVAELRSFCAGLYPDRAFQVYVPPSNIISEDGIALLADSFPEVKTIASVYLPGELAYCQEYRVEDNGIVSTPRVISGYILDDYTRLAALAELNFHLVSSHFQHPDDVLDEDRGAELGWATMFSNLSDYVHWLYAAAPSIRSMTGSEMAAAVQRYDYVEVVRSERENGLSLTLSNFYDEAWFLLRLNEGQTVSSVTGGRCSPLGGSLYLVCAQSDRVEIQF